MGDEQSGVAPRVVIPRVPFAGDEDYRGEVGENVHGGLLLLGGGEKVDQPAAVAPEDGGLGVPVETACEERVEEVFLAGEEGA